MSKEKGFSLLELMVSIVIVGIIASIAYPSYQQFVIDSRRVDAQQALMSFANAMERHKTETMEYTGAASGAVDSGPPAATFFPDQSPVDGGTAYYDLSIVSSTSRSFVLMADPIGGTTQADDGHLEVLSTGIKRWDKNNDGDALDAGENNWED